MILLTARRCSSARSRAPIATALSTASWLPVDIDIVVADQDGRLRPCGRSSHGQCRNLGGNSVCVFPTAEIDIFRGAEISELIDRMHIGISRQNDD